MSNPIGEFVEDPLSPSGYRWKRHEPKHAEPTPAAETPVQMQAVEPGEDRGQEDLSHLDTSIGPLVNTEKLGPLDAVLMQPPQYPDWTPGEEWE